MTLLCVTDLFQTLGKQTLHNWFSDCAPDWKLICPDSFNSNTSSYRICYTIKQPNEMLISDTQPSLLQPALSARCYSKDKPLVLQLLHPHYTVLLAALITLSRQLQAYGPVIYFVYFIYN